MQVSLVLPGVETVPSAAVKHLTDEQAFLVCNLPVSALVDKEFIEAFVKKGEHIYSTFFLPLIATECYNKDFRNSPTAVYCSMIAPQ